MISISKWILVLFGLFLVFAAVFMLIAPKKTRSILRTAGSTNLINYGEITLRMIPAAAFIIYADYSPYPDFFKLFGWFMIITSGILYIVPRRMHHWLASKMADMLTPLYFQLISPFSMLAGVMLICSVT